MPNRSREEDSIGVLTIPQYLCKKKLERIEQKNWLKYKDYHFNYWELQNRKFPWYCKNTDYERIKSNKSKDLTIFKDEILKNI